MINSRVLRGLILLIGFSSLAAGIIGAFLPLIPTTPFVLLAAWCFLKTSQVAHQWLYRQPILGEALLNWEKYRSIARHTKVLAIITIFVSIFFIWARVNSVWIKVFVTTLLLSVVIFIGLQKENRS